MISNLFVNFLVFFGIYTIGKKRLSVSVRLAKATNIFSLWTPVCQQAQSFRSAQQLCMLVMRCSLCKILTKLLTLREGPLLVTARSVQSFTIINNEYYNDFFLVLCLGSRQVLF